MRILIITDLEGVNGILNFPDWCIPQGRRNETACCFLTEEVNAAVDGFFQGGATEVIVLDGHGSGGSIRGEMLDKRAHLMRGTKDFPLCIDNADALAFVGQHAKAGTADAHLAHTQTEEALDFRLNGVSLGEFGQFACAFSEASVPTIFASGDLALIREAGELVEGIVTVAVKEGFNPPQTLQCPTDKVFDNESAALHYPRNKVLEEIKQQAAAAVGKLQKNPDAFKIKPVLKPPFVVEAEYRAISPKLVCRFGNLPARKIISDQYPAIAPALKNFYFNLEWRDIDNKNIFKL